MSRRAPRPNSSRGIIAASSLWARWWRAPARIPRAATTPSSSQARPVSRATSARSPDADAPMNRTGLLIALTIAVVVGTVFAIWPGLDLWLSGLFYDAAGKRWRVLDWPSGIVRDLAAWLIALIAAPAFIALIGKLVLPRRPMLVPGRAVVLMISTLALGPGLFVNVILKDNSGRPRPMYVTEFGGKEKFLPWWD